jgi:hypothetical protein
MSALGGSLNPQPDPTNFYFNERQNPYEERLGRRSENNADSVRKSRRTPPKRAYLDTIRIDRILLRFAISGALCADGDRGHGCKQ